MEHGGGTKEQLRQKRFKVLERPSQSPDLSPLENLRRELEPVLPSNSPMVKTYQKPLTSVTVNKAHITKS